MGIRRLFWPVYIGLLLAVTWLGSEAVSSFFVPSWPARAVRPVTATSTPDVTYNDWALRDRPRTFAWPPGVRFRSVLVGDSFLEGLFLRAPLSALVEHDLAEAGHADMETINFGVSATGPPQYYYRLEEVALALKPDVVVMTVYAGNDFVSTPFGNWLIPSIAELPLPSLLGEVAPRTTWLAVNRLDLSEFARGNRHIENEYELLNQWVDLPAAERLDRYVGHLHQHYFPRLSPDVIREILARDGGHFWTAFSKREEGREFVMGWLLNNLIDWETGNWQMPRDAEEADRLNGTSMVDETLSWLVAAERLAKRHGTKLIVCLVPVGTVDPAYVEFWHSWPKYFSYSLSADARHQRLVGALRRTGIQFIDLRDDLKGVAGTYRLTDGHWTERGTELVANRVSKELLKLAGH